MTDSMIFGIHEEEPQKDRDGYDLPALDYRAFLRFDSDGTVRAYEFSEQKIDDCGDEPQLDGTFVLEGEVVRFSLTRQRDTEKIEPPEEEVYWWPSHARTYFASGEYRARVAEGRIYLFERPEVEAIAELDLRRTDGKPFLPESHAPAAAAVPPPPPPPPPPPKQSEPSKQLDLSTLVSKTKWGFALVIAAIGMVVFGFVWGEQPIMGLSLWTGIALFIAGLVVVPSEEQRGDLSDAATDLAADAIVGILGRVFMFALVWGLIIYGVDVAGWAKDKAVDAYEAGKKLVQSDERDALDCIAEVDAELEGLKVPHATSERLAIERKLADDLAGLSEAKEVRALAAEAYGRAALVASSRGDLDELDKLIERQIEMDKEATK